MVKKFLIKYDIDVLIYIILCIAGVVFCFATGVKSDELWNFSAVYKMYNGFTIYKEINVITTPLFHYIELTFFNLMGANFFVFRLSNLCTWTIILILVYKIFKSLNIEKGNSITYLSIIILLLSFYLIRTGANYNTMVFIPILYGILSIIKGKYNRYKQSLVIFIIFFIKQNVSVFYIIGLFWCIYVRSENIKQFVREVVNILVALLVLITAFLISLYIKGILFDFIDYCLLGLRDFTQNFAYEIYNNTLWILIPILIQISFIIIIKEKKIDINIGQKNNLNIFVCFGIPLLLIAYPIFNKVHCLLASIVTIIGFLYFLDISIMNSFTNNFVKKIIVIIIMILLILSSYIFFIGYYKYIFSEDYIFKYDTPFFGSSLSDDTYLKNESSTYEDIQVVENMEKVLSYSKEKESSGSNVIIISDRANLYSIAENKNNGKYDLPLLGNLGKDGENRLLEDVKRLRNTYILITTDDEDLSYQESDKIRNLIKSNFEYIEDIEMFSVYYIK